MSDLLHWLDQHPDAVRSLLAERHQPLYRAQQVERWLWHGRATTFEAMTDLPAKLRRELAASFRLTTAQVVRRHQAPDGTEKLVLDFTPGRVECVLLRDGPRRTVCISSQVGCAMGCVFCASGLDGVERNLTTGEILEQLWRLLLLLPPDERVSHIVVMGMGEPLANLDRLLPALDRARTAAGLGISPRRMTISTVGLPDAMRRLAIHRPHYQLAVSLHAPNDTLRDTLVPVNRATGLDAILTAADEYFAASGRRLTFEYVLLGGVNDQPRHAAELVERLRGRTAMVNIIPYNPVAGLVYATPASRVVTAFCEALRGAGLNVQVRERKGDAIDAACGQLRRSTPGASPPPTGAPGG